MTYQINVAPKEWYNGMPGKMNFIIALGYFFVWCHFIITEEQGYKQGMEINKYLFLFHSKHIVQILSAYAILLL